jgi:hypothetical protein
MEGSIMITKSYNKQCDPGRLTSEIISSGKQVYPSSGFKFYGINVGIVDGEWRTDVLFADTIAEPEIAAVDSIVASSLPIPLHEPSAPTTDDGKPIVKTESRPLDTTTVFTGCGDDTDIGNGKSLSWDFSNTDDDISAPAGFKRKRIVFQFMDPVYIKDGFIFFYDKIKGSYIDLHVVCPAGGYYYKNNGQPWMASEDMSIAHFVVHYPLVGSSNSGMKLQPETCSGQIPSTYKFWIDVTVPDTDSVSFGNVGMQIYRTRTVLI